MNIIFNNRPGMRIGQDVLYGGIDLQRKIFSQPRCAAVVVRDGLKEFRFCFRMKIERHRPKRSLIRAKT